MNKEYSYRGDIVAAIAALLCDYCCHRHSKTLFLRFDVRFPSSFISDLENTQIQRLMKYINQYYKYKEYDPAYIWAREMHNSHNPHYHCLLLLDGQKICKYNSVFEYIEKKWKDILSLNSASGLIERCLNNPHYENGVNIRRCDEVFIENIVQAFEWTLYLAKDYSKSVSRLRMRCFNTSRYIQRDCRWYGHLDLKWNPCACPIYQLRCGADLQEIFPPAFSMPV